MDSLGKQIIVLQRGWVLVGDVFKNTELKEEDFIIKNASVIRRWGTTKGLGELAAKGPLSETVLDPIGEVSAHELTIVFRVKCNEENWK